MFDRVAPSVQLTGLGSFEYPSTEPDPRTLNVLICPVTPDLRSWRPNSQCTQSAVPSVVRLTGFAVALTEPERVPPAKAAAVFVRAKLAPVATPGAVAVAEYPPAVLLARTGTLATPSVP